MRGLINFILYDDYVDIRFYCELASSGTFEVIFSELSLRVIGIILDSIIDLD